MSSELPQFFLNLRPLSLGFNNYSPVNLQALWPCEGSVCHFIHFFSFLCYFADVWLSSGLLSSLLSWLPQRRGFPPVVCKLLLYPAPLQQVTVPHNFWLLGLGRHSLHTSPFLLTRVEWENGYGYSELSIHLLGFLTEDGLQGNKNMTGHPASCPGASVNLCHMECCPGVMFQYLENSSGAWNGLAGVLLLDMFVLSQWERYPSSISHESLWAVFPGWGVFWGTSPNERYVFVSSTKFSAGLQQKCGCDNSYLNAASEVFVGDTQHPLRADCCCLARCYSVCGGRVTNILLVVAGLLFL